MVTPEQTVSESCAQDQIDGLLITSDTRLALNGHFLH